MKKEDNNEKKLQCEIVQDLLPLYHDEVVSEVTKQAVEQHLDGCEDCKKEYEALCEEFPQESRDMEITKSKFDSMKGALKQKQTRKNIIVALATCIVVLLIGYVMIYEPIIPVSDSEFEIEAAYTLEDGDQTWLFIAYEGPAYNGPTYYRIRAELSGDEAEVSTHMRRTVINFNGGEFGIMTGFAFVEISSDTQMVTFADKVIWSKQEAENQLVPEYVKELWAVERGAEEYIIEIDEEGIFLSYEDGRYIMWDYAGNVVSEGYRAPDSEE